MTKPRSGLTDQFKKAARRFGTEKQPFGGFCMQPGVGTFASYVENGLGCAPSADGRLSGHAIGTDMSPAPSPLDAPVCRCSQGRMAYVLHRRSVLLTARPIDLNIEGRTAIDRLIEILSASLTVPGPTS
ncbi:hypothetical protein NKH93_25005 [Mesorhizobium sp. M0954]|uniref:hypothetical protein n=1 Tax=Mesorhizobium sp. M0954 TaxID=2957032 RepID=UPI003338FE18